ncbi:unnamed protein product [Rotaria socialis]|uniref:Uncharacterized protein n=1 Tax=Rotaria socialis TaxID=392032 RepID=A0A817TID2_9BILA|nr:unnamed protein product [Rotaria socialis]CAF3303266.1 unnamed protein product [Rotaria socialis]CAF3316127.1 unnamed protein product [Rotaria socialis]CAF3325570.1 unnamed protein product [Rotaria socialis]CAF3462366.1 unnamed protein product [Rotaria socialis]
MKFLLFTFFLIATFLFNYSIGRAINDTNDSIVVSNYIDANKAELATENSIDNGNSTVPPHTLPGRRVTTDTHRISSTVSIVVPVALFGLTILIGYGLITYAVISGGHGISCLTATRTNNRRAK